MDWETVIGLEVHVQLDTRSKLFSGASTAFGAAPNSQASAVDIALPGVLPVLNRKAVLYAVRLGLAVGGSIARRSVFARKNYFYPDLPKGYQISQYELPVVSGGAIAIETAQGPRSVRLTRAHIEEDAGKSLHEDFHGLTGIDLNRAGTPLLEVVSEPDMRNSAEAVAYARALHALVRYLGICDGNMQEGSFRCDANVSLHRPGTPYGTRCEVKNLNSFRFLEQAIEYEVRRQREILEDGGSVRQETRLYDPDRDETRSMRSKEDAHDYRYFPDPDLPPLVIDASVIDAVRANLPELPALRRERYRETHGLSDYDAGQLIAERATADYFDTVTAAGVDPKTAANWVLGEVAAALNRESLAPAEASVGPAALAALLQRIADGTLSGKMAKDVFDAMWQSGDSADAVIEARGLRQVSDDGALVAIVDQVIAANPQQVQEFLGGKEKVIGFLVGQAMKASGGKANPGKLNALMRERVALLPKR